MRNVWSQPSLLASRCGRFGYNAVQVLQCACAVPDTSWDHLDADYSELKRCTPCAINGKMRVMGFGETLKQRLERTPPARSWPHGTWTHCSTRRAHLPNHRLAKHLHEVHDLVLHCTNPSTTGKSHPLALLLPLLPSRLQRVELTVPSDVPARYLYT